MTTNEISRQKNLLEKVLIVNGQPGCGKTLISSILSSFESVEIMQYSSQLENIIRLNYLKKITDDATISFLKCLLDEMIYSNLMSRNINFRFSDLSSVFRYPNKLKYLIRLFNEGNEKIPDVILKTKPILHLATHDLFQYSDILHSTFDNKITFVEVLRHPLYMIKQQTNQYINIENNIARNFQIKILSDTNHDVFMNDPRLKNKNITKNINPIDLAVYQMQTYYNYLFQNYYLSNNNIIFIPFESFVLNPNSFLKNIEKSLDTNQSKLTPKILKREKVPRKKIADGIDLKVYSKLGFTKPIKGFSERDELNERIKWTKDMNISLKCSKILKDISSKYEKTILKKSI